MYFSQRSKVLLAIFTAFTFWNGILCEGDEIMNLETYLQPNDMGRNDKYDFLEDDGIRCTRNCTLYPKSRTCYYKFTIEQYNTLGAACGRCPQGVKEDCFQPQCIAGNGFKRILLSINRMFMGPAIQVCSGDHMIVDVINKMPARSIAMHWHGFLQQETPWMDGVPSVTQCAIPDGSSFRYNFKASTNGTMLYHTHTSFQRFDGLTGELIVRLPDDQEPNRHLYDYDLPSHGIHLAEWYNTIMDNKYPDGTDEINQFNPNSFVINGLGVYIDADFNEASKTPVAEFFVSSGKRYRFRIIAASSTSCAALLTFTSHKMTLIAVDGNPVAPVQIRSLYVRTGERYDVVVAADQSPGCYQILVQGADAFCHAARQYALLRYRDFSSACPKVENLQTLFSSFPGPKLNEDVNSCTGNNSICLRDVCSLEKLFGKMLEPKPDKRIFLELGEHQFSINEMYRSGTYDRHYVSSKGDVNDVSTYYISAETMNNISIKLPQSPLYTVEPPADLYCNGTDYTQYRQCLNLIKVSEGDIVDIIFTESGSMGMDDDDPDAAMSHTIHFHGNHFRVRAQGTRADKLKAGADFYKGCNTNCKQSPIKRDMVSVPHGGFSVIRFEATNIGVWVIHCHTWFHNFNGMAAIIQVGEREQFKPVPCDFPTCGNYLPPVKKSDGSPINSCEEKGLNQTVLDALKYYREYLKKQQESISTYSVPISNVPAASVSQQNTP